jgi:NADH-quinone oxidoreductase subunit A
VSNVQVMPSYLPILILGAVALGFGVFTVLMSHVLGRPRPNPGKVSTYECGMPPIGTARERFPIKFYLVCMVFILFDVDAAFLYPWALHYKELVATMGLLPLVEMGVFMALLGGGFVYVWKVGALDW